MIRYADTDQPGITRQREGEHGWRYTGPDGTAITDEAEIARLNAIGLPPAYTREWFNPDPFGHIQAIGFDARGRKQYRYHADFRAQQEAAKYDTLADFGRALPKLRAAVERDLHGEPTHHDTVVAAVVRLLDNEHIRVGSEEYAKENNSFGATTLRVRHAKIGRGEMRLSYRGKSGVQRKLAVRDRELLRVVRRVHDLPGQHLFQYIGHDGEPHPVGSDDVNAYIKAATGDEHFSAKHFRTWGASVIALEQAITHMREGHKWKLKELVTPVSEALGNTPAIARKSYIHPLVLALEHDALDPKALPRRTKYLNPVERALIALLDEAAEEAARESPAQAEVAERIARAA